MTLGIDAKRVYALSDGASNPAFWTVFTDHAHGKIVKALLTEPAIHIAVKAKLDDPNSGHKRGLAVDLINRMTVNCIGQRILGQVLAPHKFSFTIYNLLDGGTAAAIDAVISSPENKRLHDAFVAKDANAVIDIISRQTGRALFQACQHQILEASDNSSVLLE